MTELPILSSGSQIKHFFVKTRKKKHIFLREMLMIIEQIMFLTQIGEISHFKLFTTAS